MRGNVRFVDRKKQADATVRLDTLNDGNVAWKVGGRFNGEPVAGGGTSVLLFADSGSDNTLRAAAGITLAGLWGGFALGTHLTREMAPDYRFRRQQPTAMLAPTTIRDAPGLVLSGTF